MNAIMKSDADIIAKYEEERPWAQMDGESTANYVLFNAYLNCGPGRTIMKAQAMLRDDTIATSTWQGYYVKHSWRRRAEAYDEYHMALDRYAYEKERQDWRDYRKRVLKELQASSDLAAEKIQQKIEELDKNPDVTISQLIRLLQTVLAETRTEFGDTAPEASTQVNIDQRSQKVQITVMEVVKDYGKDIPPVITVDGEYEKDE